MLGTDDKNKILSLYIRFHFHMDDEFIEENEG